MKIASFDIEATGLRSTYSRVICACFKFHDEKKVRSKMARYYKNEPDLLEWIGKQWDEAMDYRKRLNKDNKKYSS